MVFPLAAGPQRKPEYHGYTRVEVAVGSGAAASVLPERCLPEHPGRSSEGPRSGVHYLAANGGRIPNQGEMPLDFVTKERHRGHIAFQVADVKRPLLAVSTLARSGNEVTFSETGGTILHKETGRKTTFVKKDGIYVLEILVAPATTGGPGGTGFARQGLAVSRYP